jgi:hypothetical protein
MWRIAHAVCPRHDKCTCSVRNQATVSYCQGIRDHSRVKHIVYCQRFPLLRFRIMHGPLAGRYRHFGQLLPGRSVLIHMPRCRESVRTQWAQRLVGHFIRLRVKQFSILGNLTQTVRAAAVQKFIAVAQQVCQRNKA